MAYACCVHMNHRCCTFVFVQDCGPATLAEEKPDIRSNTMDKVRIYLYTSPVSRHAPCFDNVVDGC